MTGRERIRLEPLPGTDGWFALRCSGCGGSRVLSGRSFVAERVADFQLLHGVCHSSHPRRRRTDQQQQVLQPTG